MILQEQLNEVKPDAQFIIQKELFHTLSNLAHQYGDWAENKYYQYKNENKNVSNKSNNIALTILKKGKFHHFHFFRIYEP